MGGTQAQHIFLTFLAHCPNWAEQMWDFIIYLPQIRPSFASSQVIQGNTESKIHASHALNWIKL